MPIISVTPTLTTLTVVSGERYSFRNNGTDTVLIYQGTAAGTTLAPIEVFPGRSVEIRANSTSLQINSQNGGTVSVDYSRNLSVRGDSFTLANAGAVSSGLIAQAANPTNEQMACVGLTIEIVDDSAQAATINVGFGPADNATLDTTIFSGTNAAAANGTIVVDSTTRVWPAASVLKAVRASGTWDNASVRVSGIFREIN